MVAMTQSVRGTAPGCRRTSGQRGLLLWEYVPAEKSTTGRRRGGRPGDTVDSAMIRMARQRVTDAGIAALATGADLGFSVACAHWHGSGHGQPGPFGMLLLGGNGLALLARRRYPVAVLGLVLGTTLSAPV